MGTKRYKFIGLGPERFTHGRVYDLEVINDGQAVQITQPRGFLSPFYDPKRYSYPDIETFENNWEQA